MLQEETGDGRFFFFLENIGDVNRIILSQYDIKNVTVFQLKRDFFPPT